MSLLFFITIAYFLLIITIKNIHSEPDDTYCKTIQLFMYIQFSQKPDFLSFLKMSADRFFIQKHMLLKIANFPNMKNG